MHDLLAWLRGRLWSTDRARFRTSLVLIALACLWAHSPALDHPPRADQWCWWIDTREASSWWERVRDFHSFARVQRIQPGDQNRYQPVPFVLFATIQSLFGWSTRAWQAVPLLLHIGTAGWLLALFWRVRPGLAAFLAALVFATLHSLQEIVVWHHIVGYSIFVHGSLAAVYFAWRYVADTPRRGLHLALALLLSGLTGFACEAGNVVCVLIGVLVAASLPAKAPERAWKGALFLLPPVLFHLASRADLAGRGMDPASVATDIRFEGLDLGAALGHLGTLLSWALTNAVFPEQWHLSHKRMHVPIREWGEALYGALSSPAAIAALALAGWWLATRSLRDALRAARERWVVIAVLAAAGLVVAGVIAAGRMLPRGGDVVGTNTHYAYLTLAFLLPAAFLLLAGAKRAANGQDRAGWLALAALVIVGQNLLYVRSANETLRAELRPARRFWEELDGFVAKHRGEPGFSFAIHPYPKEDSLHFGLHASELFFWRWIDFERPRYVVRYEGRRLVAEERPKDAETGGWIAPRYVDADFNRFHQIYRWKDRFYGLHAFECPFLPEWIPHYRYLIEEDTEEGVRRRIGEMFERFRRESASGEFIPNPPVFRWGEHQGFVIWRQAGKYWGRFWALGKEEGDFDAVKAARHLYRRCYAADSYARILEWIEQEAPQ